MKLFQHFFEEILLTPRKGTNDNIAHNGASTIEANGSHCATNIFVAEVSLLASLGVTSLLPF